MERRRTPRIRLALPCVLTSAVSSPVWAETIDVGEGGMCVRAARPLQPNATVGFDLARDGEATHIEGRATVQRLSAPRVYGLQFEPLEAPMRKRLQELVGR